MAEINIGSKCALLLPQKIINTHKTPAKGIIVDAELDKSLVLIEEVWHFKETGEAYMTRDLDGSIRTFGWGWQAIPEFNDDYLMYKPYHGRLKAPEKRVLTKMIQEAIEDFIYWRSVKYE